MMIVQFLYRQNQEQSYAFYSKKSRENQTNFFTRIPLFPPHDQRTQAEQQRHCGATLMFIKIRGAHTKSISISPELVQNHRMANLAYHTDYGCGHSPNESGSSHKSTIFGKLADKGLSGCRAVVGIDRRKWGGFWGCLVTVV